MQHEAMILHGKSLFNYNKKVGRSPISSLRAYMNRAGYKTKKLFSDLEENAVR